MMPDGYSVPLRASAQHTVMLRKPQDCMSEHMVMLLSTLPSSLLHCLAAPAPLQSATCRLCRRTAGLCMPQLGSSCHSWALHATAGLFMPLHHSAGQALIPGPPYCRLQSDCYTLKPGMEACRPAAALQVKRTEGVSSTDIVGRMLMLVRTNPQFLEVYAQSLPLLSLFVVFPLVSYSPLDEVTSLGSA